MAASPGAKCCTGMECIDRIVGGGFPAGGMISVTGPCGAGKTLFALEYLIRGAMAGQKGMYISTVHGSDKLMTYLPKLDYAEPKIFENGSVILQHIDEMGSGERDDGRITKSEADAMVSDIAEAVKKNKISRMVLDATNPIMVEMEEWVAVRRGDNYRVLEVLKMSGAGHSRAKYVMDMTSEGMLITPMLRGF